MTKEVITNRGRKLKPQKPLEAIRIKCLDCCGYCPALDKHLTKEDLRAATKEVELCEIETCALHPYRFGKNPFLFSDETRQKMSERMKRQKTSSENED